MKRPFLILSVGWAIGIGLAVQWGGSGTVWGLAGGGVLVIGGIYGYWRMRGGGWTLFLVGCCFGAAQFCTVEASNHTILPVSGNSSRAMVEGTVISPTDVDGDQVRLTIRTRRVTLREQQIQGEERILLQLRLDRSMQKEKAQTLKRGTLLAVPVQLIQPDSARNPGGFNYRDYLHRRYIHRIGEGNWRDVNILSRPFSVYGKIDSFRLFLEERLDRLYPENVAGLMKGMLLGNRKAVPAEWEEDFTSLGLVHLLAISGLHVGVFAGGLYIGATLLSLTREKAAFFSIVTLPFYAVLTGAETPVIRATVMAVLGLISIACGKWKDNLSFLGLAALFILWWNPYQLLEVGFQLSFSVTFALLMATEWVSQRIPTCWPRVNQLIAVTLIAQAASYPLLITHFHEFSLFSWGGNLLVVPVVTAIGIPIGYLSLIVGGIHEELGSVLALFVTELWSGIRSVLSFLAMWKAPRLFWPPLPWWWLTAYAGTLCYCLWAWMGGKIRRTRHGWMAGFLFIAVIGIPLIEGSKDELRITFLDVGQGDAAVIETPEGNVILVDGGGVLPWEKEPWQRKREAYDVGKRVLIPYLKYQGIQSIDWLIMTHGDADHIGGLKAVVNQFSVKHVIRNHASLQGSMETELMDCFRQQNIPVLIPKTGKEWELEPGIKWQFLYPSEKSGEENHGNDSSLVFLMTVYGKKVLMTGDVEQAGEQEIMRQWNLPQIDLLKVAHHGSRTSSGEKWLQSIQPRMAVISVGRNNRFGHPSPEVLNRFKKRGVDIWRTDQDGAITVTISPHTWKVESVVKSER